MDISDIWEMRFEGTDNAREVLRYGCGLDVMSHKDHVKTEGVSCRVKGEMM